MTWKVFSLIRGTLKLCCRKLRPRNFLRTRRHLNHPDQDDKVILALSIIFFGLGLCLLFVPSIPEDHHDENYTLVGAFTGNYFRGDPSDYRGLLVNNSKCRIPDIPIWNEQVHSAVIQEKTPNCSDTRTPFIKGLISVKQRKLILNPKAFKNMSLHQISCCYQSVLRMEQGKNDYSVDAFNKYKYSERCYPMRRNETIPFLGANFLKVICYLRNNTKRIPIHLDFHLIARLPLPGNDTPLSKKVAYWRTKREVTMHGYVKPTFGPPQSRYPNVLIIGVDSTSRLNFHRMMPSTLHLLENEFQAVEMKGFTKVAHKQFPNSMQFTTYYSEMELMKICYKSWDTSLNSCPFLWKQFSELNYLTAYIDDNPRNATLNFKGLKLGQIREPVDIYPWTWMVAAYKEIGHHGACIGSRRADEIAINYMKDLVVQSASKGVPYFVTLWLGALSHNYMTGPKKLDSTLSTTLNRLRSWGHLKNTIIIVMSDQGYRDLEIRRSLTGWYEERLPGLWISLPESMTRAVPFWKEALNYNSNKLVTPFDLHETLKDVLGYRFTINVEADYKVGTNQGGQATSLFEKVAQDRGCEEGGVPWRYCACAGLTDYQGNHSEIGRAADKVIREINEEMSSGCERIREFNVTALGVVPMIPGLNKYAILSKSFVEEVDLILGRSHLVIGFSLEGGKVKMEALLKFNGKSGEFDVVEKIRTDRARNETTSCIINSKN